MQCELYILQNRQIVKEPNILKGARDALADYFVRRKSMNRLSREIYAAGIRFVDARNQVEDGGLSRPIWPDQADNLVVFDRHVKAVNGLDAPERFRHLLEFKKHLFSPFR
jgi:hypothetical protein